MASTTVLKISALPYVTVTLPSGQTAICRGYVDGLPAWTWGTVPAGLLTRRQLGEIDMRPGADPCGILLFRHRKVRGRKLEKVSLYHIDDAVEKKPMTPGRWRAVHAALAARRICRHCGPVDHCVSRGYCHTCWLNPDLDPDK
jgi:hypothetical protein